MILADWNVVDQYPSKVCRQNWINVNVQEDGDSDAER